MAHAPKTIDVSIRPLDLNNYTERGGGNVYKAVAITGKRANDVAKQLKKELRAQLDEFSPIIDTLDEITENREQTDVAKVYEQLPKATLIAIHDFVSGRVRVVREETDEE